MLIYFYIRHAFLTNFLRSQIALYELQQLRLVIKTAYN